jgi:superfamily II DNA or RNA helicase
VPVATVWFVNTSLARCLDDSAVRSAFGASTYQRGTSYARSGRVVQLELDEADQALYAVVAGSGGQRYRTTVALQPDGGSGAFYVESYCTCPVGIDCKHAVAVMIAARSKLASAGEVVPPSADWERSLAPLTQQLTAASAGTPVALQLDAVATPSPYAAAATGTSGLRLRLRPVIPGKAGKWVRTGVSWHHLRYDYGYSPFNAEHRTSLRAFLGGHVSGSQYRYGTSEDLVFLDEFGPSLWPLLEQLVAGGVHLVTAKASQGAVTLAHAPAVATLDLTRDDDRSTATLVPRVSLEGVPLPADAVDYLGSPPHGVVVRTASGLLLAGFERPVDKSVAHLLLGNEALHIPSADLDRFLRDYYPGLQRSIEVVSTDASVSLPEVAPPRLGLTLTYRDGHRVGVEWGFEYAGGGTVSSRPVSVEPSSGAHDPVAERRVVRDLTLPEEPLPQLWAGEPGQRRLVSPVILAGMDAVLFFEEVLPALLDNDDVVVHEHGERPDFRMAQNPPRVAMSATDSADDRDWFDLGVTVSVDGEEVPFDELFTALAQGESHMLLPSGTWFALDRDELHQLRRLIEEARSLQDSEAGPLRISQYQAGLWEELRSLGVVEQQSDRWATLVAGLVDVGELEPLERPAGLECDLRPYQLDGYRWLSFLWEHGLGGILADDMGLGKTVQALALLCRAREVGQLEAPALVVAPTSVVNNWAGEAARFAPGLRVITVGETESRRGTALSDEIAGADLVVTSYALFRIDYGSYAELPWSGLVLDEAQFVKNHQAKTYQCARRLPAPFKLAITGTPLENSLMDMWALLSIVAPGLFPNPQRFSEFYRRPIERGSDPQLLASLRRRIRPLMLRRTKELVAAELPPKQEQVLEVELTPRHRKIYDTHLQRERQKVLGLIGDLDKNRFTILKSLTLLRQLSLDPALVDQKYDKVRSSKVDAFLEQLGELVTEGHRTLVFSQFTGFLRRVRDRLDADGTRYCYLDGRTRNREKAISAFKDGDAPVFLISLKAGGFGLNLTEADYCFVLDPWWNPATEAQAIDRTHRIGQDKTVMVYRLVSSGTIEEKVMALKARKAELFRSVMDNDGLLSAPLTADDIKALLEVS